MSGNHRNRHHPAHAAAFDQEGGADGGDSATFARAYVPPCVWSESTFFNGLSTGRPVAERRQVIEDFYQAYVDRVTTDPRGQAMDYVHAYMTIAKAAWGVGRSDQLGENQHHANHRDHVQGGPRPRDATDINHQIGEPRPKENLRPAPSSH